MHYLELLIILLAVVSALAEVAFRIRLPYPILLMLVGIGLGLVPGLPRVPLQPDLVFILFLPPLLYAAAGNTSWPDFKAARRPIGLLALGCVLFTTLLVATAAHYCIPGFDWPSAGESILAVEVLTRRAVRTGPGPLRVEQARRVAT